MAINFQRRTKILISVLIVVALFVGISRALAETPDYQTQNFLEQQAKIVKPGILPNSFWYWTESFWEEIKFLTTPGKQNKADFLMELAAKRLAEMRELSRQGINGYSDELQTKYQVEIDLAQELYQQAAEKTLKQAQDLQIETEKQILKQTVNAQREAAAAPARYNEAVNKGSSAVGSWFGRVLEHLKWKKGQIEQQKSLLGE